MLAALIDTYNNTIHNTTIAQMHHIEVSPTSRAKCTICSQAIARGELRVPFKVHIFMRTTEKFQHLTCYKAKPPLSITAFIGHEDLPTDQKIILKRYVASVNKSYKPSKKRPAEEDINTRRSKRLKSTISSDPTLLQTTTTDNINVLPMEIWATIFKHLPPRSVTITAQVCKMWLLLGQDEAFLRDYCHERCPALPKDDDATWKQHFKRLLKKSCSECGAMTCSGYFFNPVSARMCFECRKLDKYKLIKKTDLKDRFRLTDQDLAANGMKPHYMLCNGTKAHFYLRSQVELVAAKKAQEKQKTKAKNRGK